VSGGFEPDSIPRTAAEVFALRQAYWHNGYRPVPIYTRQKRPRGNDWRNDALIDPPLAVTIEPDQEAMSTGIITGEVVGIDVDIFDQPLVDRIVAIIERSLGVTSLLRIGFPPKILLVFRGAEEFTKLSTGLFLLADRPKKYAEAKLEILATGQQFVADGIHPDTGRPYSWPVGSPDRVPLDQIPPITLEQAQAIIARARELLTANGGVEEKRPRKCKGNGLDELRPSENFFAKVNEAALRNLGAWVKALFPQAVYQPGTGAWRVASKDRGRPDLQEDISLHPNGIRDFGLEHGLTPIDVLIEHGGAGDPVAAAHLLCERLGIRPATLGWHERRHQADPSEDPGYLQPLEAKAAEARTPEIRGGSDTGPAFVSDTKDTAEQGGTGVARGPGQTEFDGPEPALDPKPPTTGATLPPGFRMLSKGLLFDPPPTKKNPKPAPILVAAPFQILGQTRTDTGEDWGLLLCWHDHDGVAHQRPLPLQLVHQQSNEIAAELERCGLSCGTSKPAHELLKRFFNEVRIGRRLRCVARTGWHNLDTSRSVVFVLPDGQAVGHSAGDIILQAEHSTASVAYRATGDLKSWQREIAERAVGNDRAMLFLAAAFAGPLLEITGEPSGCVHLCGLSRSGKTTLVMVAASVWGPPSPDGQLRQWRATANGLEAIAAETSDTLLVLDEMGQANAHEVADIVYMLANSGGKQRADRSGVARRRQVWHVLALSTGEITLAQKLNEAGRHSSAGLDVRLVDLPADAGAGLGVFQDLHGSASPAEFVETLREATRSQHGTAAREFLARLAKDRSDDPAVLRDVILKLRARFLCAHLPKDAHAQVRSVAGRFGLIAAAGELASDYGVLPWPAGEATRAVGVCYQAWLATRSGAGPAEQSRALAQVRVFLEAHGEARFTELKVDRSTGEQSVPGSGRATINRAGYRRLVDDDWEYWILPQVWTEEVCKGLNSRQVAEWLAEGGFLLRSTARHRAARERIEGEGRRRVYVVSGTVLDAD
jgi:uncharacterized protein (DUF927 family)